ncbi:MAG: DUF2252 family protein [Phycisphaerales bacterium]|nr:DUF2252 family protein [Phycisphaerales bacterium]MCB9856334.1 DUF2252 family protein [Phycisphaerales bacterium]MCB9864006.1 DUF2252 family protein [Phycisphaerales bacterium]
MLKNRVFARLLPDGLSLRQGLGARLIAIGLPSLLILGAARSLRADPKEVAAEGSVLARVEALNPHLRDGEIPNLSLKTASLSKDPYSFFRGTADLFFVWCKSNCADWLAAADRHGPLHGDVHPGNTGTYVAEPDGGPPLAYSLVDFDEVFIGPFELDLLRAMTSLRFAAAVNQITLSDEQWHAISEQLVGAYRELWRDYPTTDIGGTRQAKALEAANARVLAAPIVQRLLAKAASEIPSEYVDDFTKGNPPARFKAQRGKKKKVKDVMIRVDDEERDAVVAAFREAMGRITHRDTSTTPANRLQLPGFDVIDVTRWIRIGSSGSQGLKKYLVLITWRDASSDLPTIFQLKEEPPCAATRAGISAWPSDKERGQFVAESYVHLQWRPKRLVGWTNIGDAQFLVKPKDPFGKEPDIDDLTTPEALSQMAELMGRLLAIAHAKSRCKTDTTALRSAVLREGLVDEIDSRSADCFAAFSTAFAAFRGDARVGEMTRKAETWLAERK